MQKKSLKVAVVAALAGTVCQFGGCLGFGDGIWGRLVWDAAIYTGFEFVTDNDGVFDLFQDDATTETP